MKKLATRRSIARFMGGSQDVDLAAAWSALPLRKRKESLRWLDHSGLALYLWRTICERRVECPSDLKEELELRVSANRLRIEDMLEEFGRVNSALQAVGVRYVVVKGFSLSPDFSGEPWLRHQSDIDLVVAEESVPAARVAIESLGYRCEGEDDRGEIRFSTPQRRTPRADDFLYARQEHRLVEVHRELFERVNAVQIVPGIDWQAHVEWRECGEASFPALDVPCRLLVQGLHCFSHVLHGWIRIGWLYEIFHFSKSEDSEGAWDTLDKLITDEKTRSALGLVLMLADELYAELPLKLRKRWVEPLPQSTRVWVQRFGEEWALEDFPGSRLSLLVHREFVDTDDAWRAYLAQRRGRTLRAVSVVGLLDAPRVARWFRQQVRFRQSVAQWRRLLGNLREQDKIAAPKGF